MTWPTTPVSTTHLDEGSDNPAQARADLKQLADNVNAIAAEFEDVEFASKESDNVIQWNGNEWVNRNLIIGDFAERVLELGQKGNETVSVDFSKSAVQTVDATDDITFSFTGINVNQAKSTTIWFKHSADDIEITWPTGTKFAYGNPLISNTTGQIDMLHVQGLIIFGETQYFVSIVRGFAE